MRVRLRIATTVTLAALVLAVRPAISDDGDDGPSGDDLVLAPGHMTRSLRGERGWRSWWRLERPVLVRPGFRARPRSDGMPRTLDPKARNRARDRLLAALAEGHWLVSSEAALALGRLGDARDIVTLAKIVEDPNIVATRRLHRWAAVGLGYLPRGDETEAARARTALMGALQAARGQNDNQVLFWGNCAYALAMRGDAAVLPELVDLRAKGLAAVDSQSSLAADVLGPICYTLAALGGEVVLPEVEEHLHNRRAPDNGSKDTSWCACHALVRIGGDEAKRIVVEATKDREREAVRRVALGALGVLGNEKDDATAALLRHAMKEDGDPTCRVMAALALARTGHASAAPALLAEFESCQSADRSFIEIALGICARGKPNPAISKVLLRGILDDSCGEDERTAFAVACGLAGIVEARPRLAELASDSNSDSNATEAATALGLLGPGPAERKVLHESVGRPADFPRRSEAAMALASAHDVTVIDQLREIVSVKSASDMERSTALLLLGRVGDDAEIDFLLETLDDKSLSAHLRAAAAHSLGRLLDPNDNATLNAILVESKWFHQPRGTVGEPIDDLMSLGG